MNDSLFPAPSTNAELITAHCDGGSRGNPGPSGYGAVLEDSKGRVLAELSEFVGIQTNNFAEYSGLLGVLRWAVEHDVTRLCVISDSELMVKQMQGKYAVKSPILRPLFEEARKLSRKIDSFEMRHTLRGGNKTADRLANEAMDRGMGKSRDQGAESGVSGAGGVGTAAARPYGKLPTPPAPQQGPPKAAAKPERQTLEGYVKDGVVHLLGGELPDGIFVKIVRE
jgi:probable phosphoglycerate mutase